jgi:hypothetical protein
MSLKGSDPRRKIKESSNKGLIEDLREMIEKAHQSIASTVNAGLTLLYWHIGNRIHTEFLKKSVLSMEKKLS